MPRAKGFLFCGGGTGGHVLPGLAVAARLQAEGASPIRWIGDPQRIEARLVPAAGIELLPLGLHRPRIRDPRWLFHATRTVVACVRELLARPPRAVIALGGYAALVPGLLAPWLRRPLIVMEQNAHAGRTNRLLARGAVAVVTQFPEAAKRLPRRRIHALGNPVRAIAALERGNGQRLRVLVVGGSLAARSLNDLVLQAAPLLATSQHIHCVHVAGQDDMDRARTTWMAAGALVVEAGTASTDSTDSSNHTGITVELHGFVDDMPTLYNRIDIAVSRAGATTVAELAVAGIGALYIPLPWAAEDHQTANAQAMARVGGAVVLPQASTTGKDVATSLVQLADHRDQAQLMGKNALRLARPLAATAVAQLVQTCAERRTHGRTPARVAARLAHQRSLVRNRL